MRLGKTSMTNGEQVALKTHLGNNVFVQSPFVGVNIRQWFPRKEGIYDQEKDYFSMFRNGMRCVKQMIASMTLFPI